MDLTDSRIPAALAASADWRSAARDCMSLFASEGRPFSSGEVATALRLHRTDLVFSVPSLGGFLRDEFYNQQMPCYTKPDGTTEAPVQIARFTVGKFPLRTPPNTEVYVYGPDANTCNNHEFEVFIPKPGETMADAPAPAVTTPASQTGPGTPIHDGLVQSLAANSNIQASDSLAGSRPDGRLHIPRDAFELAHTMANTGMQAGSTVYVTVDPGVKATISLSDPNNGRATPVKLWTDGRIAFGVGTAIPKGTHYKVMVTAGEITVDLTKAV